jgi:glyoxylase I family protein
VTRVHHSAICTRDVDASLRFYRDGLGLAVLMDHTFAGDWPALFGARSRRLRSVFLGDVATPEAGIVELVAFSGGIDDPPAGGSDAPTQGFFLLSFFVDVEETLERLAAAGFGGAVRRVTVPGPNGPVPMATVHDPDGVLVELIATEAGSR